MTEILNDLRTEIKFILKGQTFDTLIPPTLFFLLNGSIGLKEALGISLLSSISFLVLRIKRNEKWYYAMTGLIAILFSSLFVYIFSSSKSFYLPSLITSSALFLASLLSLMFNRPLAILLSHLTRGWPIKWYLRDDILPAYKEVTFIWSGLLILRTLILLYSYLNGSLTDFFFTDILLGFPSIVVVLILSYIYGIYRLKILRGPGVDEYINKSPKPWKGQRKGF